MIDTYKVFTFKSLKIVLGKTGTDYVGYARDTKYPEFNRAIIRGSDREVVEVCTYLYKTRLLAAINCEGYEVPSYSFDINDYVEVRDWVSYVTNRYLFSTFRMYYEHSYQEVTTPYIDDDGTPCSLIIDHVYDGIEIIHYEDDSDYW